MSDRFGIVVGVEVRTDIEEFHLSIQEPSGEFRFIGTITFPHALLKYQIQKLVFRCVVVSLVSDVVPVQAVVLKYRHSI